MIGLALPIVVIGAIVYFITRAARKPTPTAVTVRPGLWEELWGWVSAGLVSREQAEAIYTHEQAVAAAAASSRAEAGAGAGHAERRNVSVIAEALGYLGGALATAGLVLVIARSWEDFGTGARLALTGGGALALLAGGLLVPVRANEARARLRAVLWLASTAAAGLFGGVLAYDGFGTEAAATITLAAAGVVAVESGALWWWRTDRPLQHLTFVAALPVLAAAGVAEATTSGWMGIAAWIAGAILLVAGLRRWIPEPQTTEAVGGIALVAGAGMVAGDWQGGGFLLLLGTGLALATLALVPGLAPERVDQVVTAVVGGLTLLEATPASLGWFSRDAGAATGLVTWAAGGALVLIGARRLVRLPLLVELVGGAAIVGGAALTGTQWHDAAPVFGIATAIALIAAGMLPGQVLLSALGSVGLLINVPWAIGHFFPGEGRVPVLILVSGLLIVAIAVLMTRLGGRFRTDVSRPASPWGGHPHPQT